MQPQRLERVSSAVHHGLSRTAAMAAVCHFDCDYELGSASMMVGRLVSAGPVLLQVHVITDVHARIVVRRDLGRDWIRQIGGQIGRAHV